MALCVGFGSGFGFIGENDILIQIFEDAVADQTNDKVQFHGLIWFFIFNKEFPAYFAIEMKFSDQILLFSSTLSFRLGLGQGSHRTEKIFHYNRIIFLLILE